MAPLRRFEMHSKSLRSKKVEAIKAYLNISIEDILTPLAADIDQPTVRALANARLDALLATMREEFGLKNFARGKVLRIRKLSDGEGEAFADVLNGAYRVRFESANLC